MDSEDGKKSFVKHVFQFDDEAKGEMSNLAQYILLSLIPVVALNKTIGKYVPEADDSKSSIEIVAEIVVQIMALFFGLFFIHRLITFVPTYSETAYPDMKIVQTVLSILVMILSMQTKLGEKASILVDRVSQLWNGDESKPAKKSAQQSSAQQQSQATTTSIQSLPNESMPNYNDMYSKQQTPLVGAASPGGEESFLSGPVAANDGAGGWGNSMWN